MASICAFATLCELSGDSGEDIPRGHLVNPWLSLFFLRGDAVEVDARSPKSGSTSSYLGRWGG